MLWVKCENLLKTFLSGVSQGKFLKYLGLRGLLSI